LESHHSHNDLTGEVDVDGNATDEEINAEVREDMWNYLNLTWEREMTTKDRKSYHPDEIGKAIITVKLVEREAVKLAEREACAKIIDDMIKERNYHDEASSVLAKALKAIREQPE